MIAKIQLSSWTWLGIISFQIFFGVTVFVVTRYFYYHDPADAVQLEQSSRYERIAHEDGDLPVGSERFTVVDAQRLTMAATKNETPIPSADRLDDPDSLVRVADQHFQQGLFQEAASEYRRALERAPDNVDLYNNLGLTLHYIDRSREAVDILEQGIAMDATYQRIWLTLGFVQFSQGDANSARRALSTAAELDPSSRVGLEAMRLLNEISQ